ncbi:glycosyltransferase family 4 protein [Chloroflexota bacterium]
MEKPDNWRVCTIFAPQPARENITTVVSTLHLLEPLASELYVITGNFPEDTVSGKIHIINVSGNYSSRSSILVRVPRFIILQIKMSYQLYKMGRKFDIVFLAAGASTLVLPAILAKMMRKKIVYLHPGIEALQKTAELDYERTSSGTIRRMLLAIAGSLEKMNRRLSDRIVTFRASATSPAPERARTIPGGSRFYVDIRSFKVERNLENRDNLVGYIGRFEEIKGVMNLVRAIPEILSRSSGAKFLICGDGSQREQIEREISKANIRNKVTLTEWLPHEELPRYLNEIKLLVIPSHTEVGPQIVFEAMACGTPVLATSVGVIPDVIRDGETGFIPENNSPECIAENVVRALEYPGLNEIARKASKLIVEEYTYELAVERYREVLRSL